MGNLALLALCKQDLSDADENSSDKSEVDEEYSKVLALASEAAQNAVMEVVKMHAKNHDKVMNRNAKGELS